MSDKVTCPNCGSDDIDLNYQPYLGIETELGYCSECDHGWNEDARDYDEQE